MSTEALPLVIAASFTAGPIAAGLSYWAKKLDIPIKPTFAPFGQVFQSLLDPAGPMARNASGVNIVFIQEITDELLDALRFASRQFLAPLLVAACPPARQEDLPPDLNAIPLGDWYPVAQPTDPFADKVGAIPYTPTYFAALAGAVARAVHGLRTPRPKVLVADCDNTLWDGAVGEEGPGGVRLGEARREIMGLLVEQQRAGRLICLASRNTEADVMAVLERPDAPLKRDHLAAWRIDWRSKADNLRDLAAELNLGLDSFVFIDDNPVECAQVRAACPEVLTLRLPSQPEAALTFLRHVWPLDVTRVTAEDRDRTHLYRQERERREQRLKAPTLEEFLAGLELEVRFEPLRPQDHDRAAQLSLRTNQFTLNGIRHSDFTQGDWTAIRVRDRFGDYGLTGLAGHSIVDGTLRVHALMLSCRVLGRGVEERVLAHLESLGAPRAEFDFEDTGRNQPARDFLNRLSGYALRPPTPSETSAIAPAPALAPRTDTELITHIAEHLTTAEAIAEAMTPSVPAGTLEARVMGLWEEVLGRSPASPSDNFFALGGQSLQVVQFMARARQAFGVELPVDLLFTPAFTVAEVSAAILELQLGGLASLDAASSQALLDEVEALSEDEIEALLRAENPEPQR